MNAVHDELARALERLDARLEAAVREFDARHGGPVSDRWRGLYVSSSDAHGLVQERRVSSPAPDDAWPALWPPEPGTVAARLVSSFGLGSFELDALLIALAPEIDLRYERLYAYLQDDVTRRRPTVDLVLGLLCGRGGEGLARRAAFASDGTLLRAALVVLVSDPNQVQPPLLAQYVKPDEQVVRLVLGDGGLDSRLAACCSVVRPTAALAELAVSAETQRQLARVAGTRAGACLWFHGPEGAGKRQAAEALARELGATMLVLDGDRVEPAALEATLRLARREAWFRRALLYVGGAERWLREPRGAATLMRGLEGGPGGAPIVLSSTEPSPAELLGTALPLAFPPLEAAQRALCWRQALARGAITVEDEPVAALASRYRLTPAQISSAVSDALLRAGGRGEDGADFVAAARAQSGRALAAVADKIEPRATWGDIVLPPDALAQLREMCERVDHRARVFGEWGFARKLSRGRGTTALFSGGSGTGKTMAAEVVASALGLDLYRIDLARVVSKYIGETEKNLARVFEAAEDANAILFFDEADALFGKRSEVKDAHDRYANIEVAYLLQKMEDYEGVAILASNLAESLDEAMARRLAFHVYFPFPDEGARRRIWEGAWSEQTPLAPTLDPRALARELRLSGGSIRNVALGAAFLAAGEGGVVERSHVVRAARREHQKSGRSAALPPALAEGKR